ncbi:DUF4397 domain-containing protein [Deinococcus apachensis]|uniref:DUF4397 domain-containing protein n=1 Tax=Deinococcus apachensis TaxID=309886 RepID=UPI00036B5D4F|nr:DUF4397 domain-containing protein [Deinococcus apachensis]
MRTPKTLKALLLSALVATSALAVTASAAPVYFENDSGASGVVDVYVDGQLVFNDVFAASTMMFPKEISSGSHEVVVTPFYLAPGEADVLRTTINVPADENSSYTLALATTQNDLEQDVLGLSLDEGYAE